MPAHELHPEDAAAMREQSQPAGSLRQEISNTVVNLFKQRFGRGPISCRTYLEADLVVLVMAGGYTPGERTMFDAGRWYDVRQARMAWQDSMETRFVEAIERLTHRSVKAFMSANHQGPDITVELFVLNGDATDAG